MCELSCHQKVENQPHMAREKKNYNMPLVIVRIPNKSIFAMLLYLVQALLSY